MNSKKLLVFLCVAVLALCMAATVCAQSEITFALQNEPDGFDPSVTNNSFASIFLANCFEGLTTLDTTNGSVIGGNAESWDISADGTVYTFHLRQGLKWSDGSPLTAKDYVYTFQRIATPATTARYLSLVTDYVKNAQEFYDGKATADEFGVKAVDDNTLEITLKAPTPFFTDLLTMWTFSPVQQATIEANGDKWTASADTYVSNGPFKVSEFNMGESVVLVKNANYWDADAVKLDKVTLRYIKDAGTALSAYESNEIDGSRSVPASDIARLKAENAGLHFAPAYGTVYYDINCKKAPYDNVLVRKALNMAIDRDSLINDVAQVDGTPAFSFIAPGYTVDGEDFTDGRSNFDLSEEADVEGAKKALADAGYPDGKGFPTMQLSYYTNDNVKKIVEALAQMWETNLGIKVEISNEEWAVYYDNVVAGNFEVGAMGWSGDYLHPMTFLPLAYTGDPNNLTGYSNPDYDALVDKARVTTDPKEDMDIMRQADNLVSAEYPFVTLYYKSNMLLMKDYVKGWYDSATDIIYLKNAYVEK